MHDAIVSPIDGRSLTCGGLAQPYRPRMSKHRHVADWSNFERANSSQATTIHYLGLDFAMPLVAICGL